MQYIKCVLGGMYNRYNVFSVFRSVRTIPAQSTQCGLEGAFLSYLVYTIIRGGVYNPTTVYNPYTRDTSNYGGCLQSLHSVRSVSWWVKTSRILCKQCIRRLLTTPLQCDHFGGCKNFLTEYIVYI